MYLPDPAAEVCPYRMYKMTSQNDDWTQVVHKGMWILPKGRIDNIVFLQKQVSIIVT